MIRTSMEAVLVFELEFGNSTESFVYFPLKEDNNSNFIIFFVKFFSLVLEFAWAIPKSISKINQPSKNENTPNSKSNNWQQRSFFPTKAKVTNSSPISEYHLNKRNKIKIKTLKLQYLQKRGFNIIFYEFSLNVGFVS